MPPFWVALTRLEREELTGRPRTGPAAAFTAELERCCPPGHAGTLMVVPGEFTDAERYGAQAAADAHAMALVSEGPARMRISR